jgi:hypothetical protein
MSAGNPTLLKSMKKVPSKVIEDQMSGKSIFEQYPKPRIIQFLNTTDNSINVDEPIFAPEPHVIQFTNYEELQTKEAILKLRNKDKVAR